MTKENEGQNQKNNNSLENMSDLLPQQPPAVMASSSVFDAGLISVPADAQRFVVLEKSKTSKKTNRADPKISFAEIKEQFFEPMPMPKGMEIKKLAEHSQSQILKKIKEELFKPNDDIEDAPPSNEDDIELIRKSLIIQRSPERLRVIAVVIDREDNRSNELSTVRCGGDPLGCYAYNTVTDSYYIHCLTYQDLGPISVSYRLKTAIGVDSNSNNIIALPDEVVEKYLSPPQKKNLKSLREKYKSPKYHIHFMQSIHC